MANVARISRPHGLWDSPISAASLAGDRRLESPQWDSDGGTIVWLEGRSGRGVLVAQQPGDDAPRELNRELSVRAEVSYGGGDFTVRHGVAYFVVHKTGRVYRQALDGGEARPITPPAGFAASPVVSPDGRWLAYVHHDDQQVDRLAIVDVHGRAWPQILTQGHDFYMQPTFSPDGSRLAWVAWDHPNMPWDGTWVYVARVVADGSALPQLADVRQVGGGPETAIFQPEFTLDGRLLYVSEESGWGRIVLHDLATGQRQPLTPDGVEHGTPAWIQGLRTYAVLVGGRHIAAVRNQQGFSQLRQIDLATGEDALLSGLEEYTDITQITASPTADAVAFVASSAVIPPRIVACDLSSKASRILARASSEAAPASALARCEPIEWNSGGETVHGLLYAPASDRFTGTGKPPLVVRIHGGPTSQARASWQADAQFFATRGYAVLYANYRGSTGYGRAYMLRLRGNWGLCDVEDSVTAARHLAAAGLTDPQRAVIMGGSAGGFTVLETMCRHPQAFAAGISMYGVANQFALAADTHKFEARYLDSMLGPLPEAASIYHERSPVFHADLIRRPLAVFQGDIDTVVPRNQSDAIVAALKKNNVPHVYHVYEGEGHGWRKSETIEHFYQTIDSFLRQHVIYACGG